MSSIKMPFLFLKKELQTLQNNNVVSFSHELFSTRPEETVVDWHQDALSIYCHGKYMWVSENEGVYACVLPCFPPMDKFITRLREQSDPWEETPAVFAPKNRKVKGIYESIQPPLVDFEFHMDRSPFSFTCDTRLQGRVRRFIRTFVSACMECPDAVFPRGVDFDCFRDADE